MPDNATPWPAPAKLNLLLNITAQRSDGYHELQTVFTFLDYGDELEFHIHESDRIHCVAPVTDLPMEQDLVYRAAKLLKTNTGYPGGADIHLHKLLPMGGGLGGGSSDAATTLVALNHLWATGLDLDQLAHLGLQLGADVPVFIHGQATWAEGVGEVFSPITLPEPWYVVIHPGCHVSTGEIFSAVELTRQGTPIKIRDFSAGRVFNVCEPVVRNRYPAVDEAMNWLAQYGKPHMTGTGACIFTEVATAEKGRQICEALPEKWQGFVAKGLNRSPLLTKLANMD